MVYFSLRSHLIQSRHSEEWVQEGWDNEALEKDLPEADAELDLQDLSENDPFPQIVAKST